MIRKIGLGAVAAAAVLSAACNREGKNVNPPAACFVADRTEVFVGEPVFFDNCSQNADHYLWDFGDSTYSTAEDVTKAFALPGRYLVKLTAYDAREKNPSIATALITVKEGTKNPPRACFSAPDTVETNERILFLNCSEYALTYEWDFGDGAVSTAINPVHTYSQEGVYQVKLTAHGVRDTRHDTSRTIVVQRPIRYYLSKIRLTQFPPNKGSVFDTWDPVQGGITNVMPDIFVTFKPQSGYPVHSTPVKQNQLSAPVEWNISNVELTDETWIFEVYDDDSQDGGSQEQMGSVAGNIIRLGGKQSGKVTLSSTDGSIELEVHYVVQ